MQYSQKISTPPRLAPVKLQRWGNEERLRTAFADWEDGCAEGRSTIANLRRYAAPGVPFVLRSQAAQPHSKMLRGAVPAHSPRGVSSAHERYAGGGVPPMLAQQFFTPRSSLDLFFTFNVQYLQKNIGTAKACARQVAAEGVRKCTWGMAQPQSLSRHGDGLRFCPEKRLHTFSAKIYMVFAENVYDLLKRYV